MNRYGSGERIKAMLRLSTTIYRIFIVAAISIALFSCNIPTKDPYSTPLPQKVKHVEHWQQGYADILTALPKDDNALLLRYLSRWYNEIERQKIFDPTHSHPELFQFTPEATIADAIDSQRKYEAIYPQNPTAEIGTLPSQDFVINILAIPIDKDSAQPPNTAKKSASDKQRQRSIAEHYVKNNTIRLSLSNFTQTPIQYISGTIVIDLNSLKDDDISKDSKSDKPSETTKKYDAQLKLPETQFMPPIQFGMSGQLLLPSTESLSELLATNSTENKPINHSSLTVGCHPCMFTFTDGTNKTFYTTNTVTEVKTENIQETSIE